MLIPRTVEGHKYVKGDNQGWWGMFTVIQDTKNDIGGMFEVNYITRVTEER